MALLHNPAIASATSPSSSPATLRRSPAPLSTSGGHSSDFTHVVIVSLDNASHSKTGHDTVSVPATKNSSAEEVIARLLEKVGPLRSGGHRNAENGGHSVESATDYDLVEATMSGPTICRERRLAASEHPVRIQLLWPHISATVDGEIYQTRYRFVLRRREVVKKTGPRGPVGGLRELSTAQMNHYLNTLIRQPQQDREYQDLCHLPDLNEVTLLEHIRRRFEHGDIYTYVGSILISVNPFRFYPIYNPKYVEMYQNRRLAELPPHVFAVADGAYQAVMRSGMDQCIVISGESGSGKTESTNLLLHHLSALSQRAFYSNGIEQSILGVGPVLEAFGNAKTVHNNNSSRFGKFVQINFKENGTVHGASVEKYLLEKSRIVSQAQNERNYHVFYYMLAGASLTEVATLSLSTAKDYHYLNQNHCYQLEGGDFESEVQEFARLRLAMETVGLSPETQRRIFTVLAAVLHLGNIEFKKKSEHGHLDESVSVKNMEQVKIVSDLLKVTEQTLQDALTRRKTIAGGDTVIMCYKMAEAVAARDVTAKCLYAALFDWIVLQINTTLLSKKDTRVEHQGNSIGVLDIFGFEDFTVNSFEQFCINYANESLHYYFNQHIFKFEQEEYLREGIEWKNIEFIDNTACLDLFAKKPTGLLQLLDEECNFPGATNESLLAKFNVQHQTSAHYEMPQTRQSAFSILHYAGKVKYNIRDFREKNNDLMRQDIVTLLKNSNQAFIRELVGQDPLAVLRWSLVRVFFRACFAFIDAGQRHRKNAANNMLRYGGLVRPPQTAQRRMILLSDSGTSYSGESVTGPLSPQPDDSAAARGPCTPGIEGAEEKEKGGKEKLNRHSSCPLQGLKGPVGSNTSPARLNKMNPANDTTTNAAAFIKSPRKSGSKVYKPRIRQARQMRELQTRTTGDLNNKTLGGLGGGRMGTSKAKSKPPSNSAQFHSSLQKLMETLNQANPFFIRCIKSNAEKAPCKFDDELVQRQLRYTGMLATVRIRQSGYNYRLPFEDFIRQYHLLLPAGKNSTREDIESFLRELDLNRENYQIGETRVFLREAEKMLLEGALHQILLKRITTIQRWIRARLQRKQFIRQRSSVVIVQSLVRSFVVRRRVSRLRQKVSAAIAIQRIYRGYQTRSKRPEVTVTLDTIPSISDQKAQSPENSIAAVDINTSGPEIGFEQLTPGDSYSPCEPSPVYRTSPNVSHSERMEEQTIPLSSTNSSPNNASSLGSVYSRRTGRYFSHVPGEAAEVVDDAGNDIDANLAECTESSDGARTVTISEITDDLRTCEINRSLSSEAENVARELVDIFTTLELADSSSTLPSDEAEKATVHTFPVMEEDNLREQELGVEEVPIGGVDAVDMGCFSQKIKCDPDDVYKPVEAVAKNSAAFDDNPVATGIKPVVAKVRPVVTEVTPIASEVKPIVTEVKHVVTNVGPVVAKFNPVVLEIVHGHRDSTVDSSSMDIQPSICDISSANDLNSSASVEHLGRIVRNSPRRESPVKPNTSRISPKSSPTEIPTPSPASLLLHSSDVSEKILPIPDVTSICHEEEAMMVPSRLSPETLTASTLSTSSPVHLVTTTITLSSPPNSPVSHVATIVLPPSSSDSKLISIPLPIDEPMSSAPAPSYQTVINLSSLVREPVKMSQQDSSEKDSSPSRSQTSGDRSDLYMVTTTRRPSEPITFSIPDTEPAVIKYSSEESLTEGGGGGGRLRGRRDYALPAHSRAVSGRKAAPIAKMESFHEPSIDEEDEGVEIHKLTLDDDDHLHLRDSQQAMDESMLNASGVNSNIKSPYQGMKKMFKDIITSSPADQVAATTNGSSAISARKQKKHWGSIRYKSTQQQSQQGQLEPQLSGHIYKPSGGSSKYTPPLAPKVWKDRKKQGLQAYNLLPGGPKNESAAGGSGVVITVEFSTAGASKWNVSGTSLWQYPVDNVLTNGAELKQLEQFIQTKITGLSKDGGRKDTASDTVFKRALMDFHSNLITQIPTAFMENSTGFRYCDLMEGFEKVLKACSTREDFPTTIGINAFRGFIDEFIKKKENKELPEIKVKHKPHEKKKKDDFYELLGHKFVQIQFTIPTYCEHCQSLLWVLDKGQVCKVCKLTLHKKCISKISNACTNIPSPHNSRKPSSGASTAVIGCPLADLMRNSCKVPFVIERLLNVIELKGLYTEGLYRKGGLASRIKDLIKDINTDASKVDFNGYNVHDLTAVLKTFFRELPEPVLTFKLYHDFLRAAEINDEKDRLQSLITVVDKLPQINRDLLERLIFHLAKVAHQESSNRMSASSLAIIFAPSMLRTSIPLQAQESLVHVPVQTRCLQCMIEAHMKKIETTLHDIQLLDSESLSTSDRLTALRESRRNTKKNTLSVANVELDAIADDSDNAIGPSTPDSEREEMKMLSDQLQCLQYERELLIDAVPSLDYRVSVCDDDDLMNRSSEDEDEEEMDSDECTDKSLSYKNDEDDDDHAPKFFRNLTRQHNRPRMTKTTKHLLATSPSPLSSSPVTISNQSQASVPPPIPVFNQSQASVRQQLSATKESLKVAHVTNDVTFA